MASEGSAMTAELKQNAATGAPARSWKPYPAYKDSGVEWLGKVPQRWEMKFTCIDFINCKLLQKA